MKESVKTEKLLDHRLIWIGLGLLALLIKHYTARHPLWIEHYYSRNFFHWIRWVLDHTIGLLPFASLYVLILLLIVFLARGGKKLYRGKGSFYTRLGNALINILATAGAIVFFFQLLWGLNYNRVPLEQQLGLQPRALDKEELQGELAYSLQKALKLRTQMIPEQTVKWNDQPGTALEVPLRKAVERMLASIDYPDSGQPRLRFLYPRGSLLVWNTAGFYNPLGGECQVDPGLHPLQIPFVMAHEFCHAYGFTDEGSCNFLAWLACTQSEEPLLQYSAHLTYWRYLASSYRSGWKEEYRTYYETLPEYFLNDLREIDAYSNRYPELFPKLRYKAYDAYLKSQGVKEGMKSYSRMVLLCSAWRRNAG